MVLFNPGGLINGLATAYMVLHKRGGFIYGSTTVPTSALGSWSREQRQEGALRA